MINLAATAATTAAKNVNIMQVSIGLIIAIAFLLFAVLWTKIHPFIALIISAAIAGIIGGMKLGDISGAITTGFGNTLASIGIIIGFGVIMGQIFEYSGAAERMARVFLKICGKGNEELAMAFTGFVVSIPIFCDSGFVILSPLAKAISKRTHKSVISLGVSLAAGLVITHSLVPPTPGPLGAAGQFNADIGQVLLWGIVLSIPMTIVAMFYAKWIGKRIYQLPSDKGDGWVRLDKPAEYRYGTIDETNKNLPSTFSSFAPIIIPILLILISTISTAAGYKGGAKQYIDFLGAPVIAVGIGVLYAIFVLLRKVDKKTSIGEMEKGIRSAGVILLVTGGGGALGNIIRASGAGDAIAKSLAKTAIPAIILPFIIATLVRLIQGSGTVAMITSASITAPILLPLGINPAMATLSACVGSLCFSHFNDSYFWVVNRLLGIDEAKEQIRVWSFTSTICWATGFVALMILNIFVH
ncbi:MAG: GntP family permease [Bacillota bacterium]|nr:GntP family permease [Bacillota bacterium]